MGFTLDKFNLLISVTSKEFSTVEPSPHNKIKIATQGMQLAWYAVICFRSPASLLLHSRHRKCVSVKTLDLVYDPRWPKFQLNILSRKTFWPIFQVNLAKSMSSTAPTRCFFNLTYWPSKSPTGDPNSNPSKILPRQTIWPIFKST